MRIGYARVSTLEQNPDLQLDALKAAKCERIFLDRRSGAGPRPTLDEALSHLRAGDELVVWRLDRLGRNQAHLTQLLADLKRRDVAFVSLTESIDTNSISGELVLSIFAAVAEFERNLIRERTLAGLAAAKKRGVKPGRKARELTKDERKTAETLLLGDMSAGKVAKQLRIARSTLYRHFPGGRSALLKKLESAE